MFGLEEEFMKNSVTLALFGLVVIAGIPVNATASAFNFTTSSTTTAGGITASAYAFEATGTGYTGSGATLVATTYTNLFGPTSTGNNAPSVGVYSGDGLGICEGSNQNSNSNDCTQPNHQINNGPNNTLSGASPCASGNPCDFEFMLFQFGAAVNLSQIQLGNFGSSGSATNPFNATYWTSSSLLSLSSIETDLEGKSVGGVTGTDGFSTEAQTSCATGQTTLGPGANGTNGTYNDGCALNTNGIDNLSGTGVKYLLIGASVAAGQPGQDAFKIQDISFTATATPEPATFGVIGLSLAGLELLRRKRKLN
jgi:hypothetical protein